MSICKSRKWVNSIMAHQGFSEVTIQIQNTKIVLPKTCINQTTGLIKKSVQANIECLNTKALKDKGATCELYIITEAK